MGISPEQYNEIINRPAIRARNPGHQHSELQKFQDAYQRPIDNEPKASKDDAENHPRYKISVELYYSDNYRRDADGALATILDCLIAAGRQLSVGADTGSNSQQSSQGKRRRKDND